MKEIVSFFVGQCGLQLGSSVWELMAAEHDLAPDGTRLYPDEPSGFIDTFFDAVTEKHYSPRSIMVDTEPSVADEIRVGVYRELFQPPTVISGSESASDNFARGLFHMDMDVKRSLQTEIRRAVEKCDGIQAFNIFRSLGGGTGSGTTVVVCDILLDYAKVTRVEVPIYPSPSLASSTVEAYNAVLGEHYCMEDMDVGLLFDNEAIYDICYKYMSITNPHYHHLNRLIAQVMSTITSCVRFENCLCNDIVTLQTNLVPYPRIHFPMCNFAPLSSPDRQIHEPLRIPRMVRQVFDTANQMVKCDTKHGRYMACSLFIRGLANPSEIYDSLNKLKMNSKIRFVDWDPTGFKVGISPQPPRVIPHSMLSQTDRNVAMVANHTSIGQAWSRLMHKFQMLYSKRAFVHWYVSEGLEEGELNEAMGNMQALVKDYEKVAEETERGEDDEDEDESESEEEGEEAAKEKEEVTKTTEKVEEKQSEEQDTAEQEEDKESGDEQDEED